MGVRVVSVVSQAQALRCDDCGKGQLFITVARGTATCECGNSWSVEIEEPKVIGRHQDCDNPVSELDDQYGSCLRCGSVPLSEVDRRRRHAKPNPSGLAISPSRRGI